MFLARIDGTLTATRKKHDRLAARALPASRSGSRPTAARAASRWWCSTGWARGRGSTVLVSTDGTIARDWLGKSVPARLVVVGIVDRVHAAERGGGGGVMRLGIVRGHVVLRAARSGAAGHVAAARRAGDRGEPRRRATARAAARRWSWPTSCRRRRAR